MRASPPKVLGFDRSHQIHYIVWYYFLTVSAYVFVKVQKFGDFYTIKRRKCAIFIDFDQLIVENVLETIHCCPMEQLGDKRYRNRKSSRAPLMMDINYRDYSPTHLWVSTPTCMHCPFLKSMTNMGRTYHSFLDQCVINTHLIDYLAASLQMKVYVPLMRNNTKWNVTQ